MKYEPRWLRQLHTEPRSFHSKAMFFRSQENQGMTHFIKQGQPAWHMFVKAHNYPFRNDLKNLLNPVASSTNGASPTKRYGQMFRRDVPNRVYSRRKLPVIMPARLTEPGLLQETG
jgi:hypothetical protein